ncbi:MAG: ATP-binding protein [Steroidobacteraceae bacterium]
MNPRILLLEDDATDALLTRRALERGGVLADVTVAESRKEFIRALDGPSINLVISDSSIVDLPTLDAIALTDDYQPQASFIVLSGAISPRQAQQVREAGAIAWLEKQDLSQLIPIVSRTLEQKKLPKLSPEAMQDSGQQLITANFAAQRLVQAVKELSAARDVATIQAIVRTAARELNGADGATFVLRDNDKCFYADEDAITPLWKGQRFPMSACISGWAMLNKQPAVVPDIELDARIPLDAYRPTFVRSLVMVPIRTESPIGAIGNYWATPHEATEEETALIQALADSTSIALENVRVYQELEQRVADRTAELKDSNQALEEFSYFVSHDLKAPLRHIRAFSEILKEELNDNLPTAADDALRHIQTAARSMGDLLDGLLNLAHSGRQSLQITHIDMNELVTAAVNQAKDTAAKSVEFKIEKLPDANGDRVLLRQVWTNFISNAVKYSSATAHSIVEVGSREIDGKTCYFVRDNGVGFDKEDAKQLFGAFQRLETGKQFAGNGVGLAIVHRIISRHGGQVWAESKRGEGATFYFSLS